MKIVICIKKRGNMEQVYSFKQKQKDDIYIWTEQEQLNINSLETIQPDLIFFPHWSYIVPKEIYEKYTCVVFHMTDLPFGRGGSPLQNLIVRGFKETKLSAIKMTGELDAGPIYMKENLSLEGTAEEIYTRAWQLVFDKMIPRLMKELPEPKQQEGEIVVFKRRKPEQSELCSNMSKEDIYNHIRMLDAEEYPHAFISFGKYKVQFTKAQLEDGKLRAWVEFVEEEEDE